MRPFAAVLLLLVSTAGCDSYGVDPVPLDDVLIVGVDADGTLRLVTEGTPGCFVPIVAEADRSGATVDIRVFGLEPVTGPTCLALTPSIWETALPQSEDRLTVEIRHRGETDVYTVTATRGGYLLEPVRTSVTRPAA
jgi:hypothetical protein